MGVPATGNRWLLTDVLRAELKFPGLVVSDYEAPRDNAVCTLTNSVSLV